MPLAVLKFLSMRRVFALFSQPIRFAGFDGKSVNRGLRVFYSQVAILGADPKALLRGANMAAVK